MKCAIELEAFAMNVKLPDGFRFKEWQPGNLLACSPDQEGHFFINVHLGAIERISDEKFATFEISSLRKPDGSSLERGKVFIPAESLVAAVDKAISELEKA